MGDGQPGRSSPSLHACSFSLREWGLIDLLLRASNDVLPFPCPPFLGKWPRLPFTARIERAHSDRARSASKKGTWPLPSSKLAHYL